MRWLKPTRRFSSVFRSMVVEQLLTSIGKQFQKSYRSKWVISRPHYLTTISFSITSAFYWPLLNKTFNYTTYSLFWQLQLEVSREKIDHHQRIRKRTHEIPQKQKILVNLHMKRLKELINNSSKIVTVKEVYFWSRFEKNTCPFSAYTKKSRAICSWIQK